MIRAALLLAALSACATSSASSWRRAPHDQRFQQVAAPRQHPRPQTSAGLEWWDQAYRASVGPLARALSPVRLLDAVAGNRRALDVNHFGEVPDSPWFANRIGRRSMTPDQIARGPDLGGPPAAGLLHVLAGKPDAVTPSLVVRDPAGVRWVIVLDPPAFPELCTGAEAVSSRLLWAAGWHVPDTHVVDLELARLRLAPGATRRDRYRRRVPLDAEDLRALLVLTNPDPRGRVRALFRREVPGAHLGPFDWRGTRRDDPNDRIPHERRRSLRGMWLFQAWLNIDRQNTLDSFMAGGQDRGWVRHWIVDLGDSLGATAGREKHPSEGYQHMVPWANIAGQAFTLGLRYPYWNRVQRSRWRSVGIFEADIFDPARWRPRLANPAFEEATTEDTFWAAAILAHLGSAHVRAAIAAAGYAERGAAEEIHRVLMHRRAKLLRFAFRRMLALGDPEVAGDRLQLRDLEADAGLVGGTRYRYHVRWNRSGRGDLGLVGGSGGSPELTLGPAIARARTADPAGFAADPFLTVTWWRPRGDRPGPRVQIHLRVIDEGILLVGMQRERRSW